MILLARHGETDWNRAPARVMGHTDIPLNETGRAQAAELAEHVRDRGLGRVISSHLARARETAALVAAALDLAPAADPRFAETRRGAWEGRTWAEIAAIEPEAYGEWRERPAGFRFPGGESLAEHMDRVVAAIQDLEHGPPVLVVCHGGSIRVALCHTRGRGLGAFHEWDVPNGALVELS